MVVYFTDAYMYLSASWTNVNGCFPYKQVNARLIVFMGDGNISQLCVSGECWNTMSRIPNLRHNSQNNWQKMLWLIQFQPTHHTSQSFVIIHSSSDEVYVRQPARLLLIQKMGFYRLLVAKKLVTPLMPYCQLNRWNTQASNGLVDINLNKLWTNIRVAIDLMWTRQGDLDEFQL